MSSGCHEGYPMAILLKLQRICKNKEMTQFINKLNTLYMKTLHQVCKSFDLYFGCEFNFQDEVQHTRFTPHRGLYKNLITHTKTYFYSEGLKLFSRIFLFLIVIYTTSN